MRSRKEIKIVIEDLEDDNIILNTHLKKDVNDLFTSREVSTTIVKNMDAINLLRWVLNKER